MQVISKIIRVSSSIAVIALIVITALEILLSSLSTLLPFELNNVLHSKYHTRYDGIYYYCNALRMHCMKTNFIAKMYYNGYTWSHRTNDIGIRRSNTIKQAGIVILGDSFVYGHGVNDGDTIADNLEKMSGKIVANLGVQGDYLVTEYARLKNLGLYLKPKYAIIAANGSQDASDYFINQMDKSFINLILSLKVDYYGLNLSNSPILVDSPKGATSIRDHLWDSNLYKLYKFFSTIKTRHEMINPQSMPEIMPMVIKILSNAKDLTARNNTKLMIVLLANERSDELKWRTWVRKNVGLDIDYRIVVKQACTQLSIPCLDLNDYAIKNEYFLLNDYHYSPAGNKWAAEIIHQFIKKI